MHFSRIETINHRMNIQNLRVLVELKSQKASEELKECPRLISSGSLSIMEEASPTFPNRSEAPVKNNIDSAKEVLPDPPCPTIPILRISVSLYCFIFPRLVNFSTCSKEIKTPQRI